MASMGRALKAADTSTLKGRFGANLRELRLERFDTQDEFVTALHRRRVMVTKSAVSGWEMGTRAPDLDLWPRIAATLGVELSDLLPEK